MNKSLFFLVFFTSVAYAENSCEDFIQCLELLRAKVELNTYYDQEIVGSGLSGEVRIVIDKGYSLKSVTLEESSGNRQFDNSILNGVKRVKSFRFLSRLSLKDQENLSDIALRFNAPKNNGT